MLVLECTTIQLCVKACADLQYISFLSVCFSFSQFLISHIIFFGPTLYIIMLWSSTILKYSFNMIYPFLSRCLFEFPFHRFGQLCVLYLISLWPVFLHSQFFLSISRCLISRSSVHSTGGSSLFSPANVFASSSIISLKLLADTAS